MPTEWKKLWKKQHGHIGTIASLLQGLYHFSLTSENSSPSRLRAIWARTTHRMSLIVCVKQAGTFADVNWTALKVVVEL